MCKEELMKQLEAKDQLIEMLTKSNERKQKQLNKIRDERDELLGDIGGQDILLDRYADEIKLLRAELANYKQLQRDYVKLVEDTSFKCPDCGAKMHWESDIDMYDYIEEEGIISFYHCCNCGIETEVRRYDEREACRCADDYMEE